MSYGFDLKEGARRLAAQVVEILNGGNPAEMPFFQQTHFSLVIKTAKLVTNAAGDGDCAASSMPCSITPTRRPLHLCQEYRSMLDTLPSVN
jgi:hypothetical protein